QLVKYARNRLHQSLLNRDASPQELAKAEEVLDPSVLTIGFARRFATYKRATLFLKDLERIRKIITGNGRKDRRVQFVVAGKAHPKDIPGKELIRSIIHFTRDEGLDSSIVFVPNYDIHTARAMVAGADVWLNNPRRPREASGTSGMKAAMNGLLNLSVLDGWWDEADYVKTGWAIGSGEVYDDPDYQDEVEANALYELIEKEVVPLFYDRDENNVPRGWVAKMKNSVYLNTPLFNTSRMVKEYARRAYFMASDRLQQLSAVQFEPARELSAWQTRLYERWYAINIEAIDIAAPTDLQVNQTFNVQAKIALGQLSPEDVAVELYQGTVQVDGEMHSGTSITMEYQGQDTTGKSLYRAEMQYSSSGLQGLSLRLLPKHRYLHSSLEPRLILWAQPESVKVSVGPAVPTVAPAQAAAIVP
ncbi:MAG: alpha-glucan family phosphorylase, partial [Cyanobacteria bacterium P01_D01_bin.71]